jgi:methyl-accepting chemotaxis protein
LGQVRRNIASVAGAVSSLSSASQQVAHHSGQQSSAASAMASAMEQMTANLAEIAHNAGHVDEASRASGERSREGSAIIGRATAEMGEIASTVQSGSASIDALGQQSQKISAIVQVIREIADQTNLLALNAAIEAARAGEAGRGFAVVADEVRKLAERTAQSTQQIGDMIQAIQGSAKGAVRVMDDTVRRVDTGVELAGQAAASIVQITDSVDTLLQGVAEISNALRQQGLASQDMARHVERIAGMTEENSHAANQTAQAAQDLEGLAADMRQAVERFKL